MLFVASYDASFGRLNLSAWISKRRCTRKSSSGFLQGGFAEHRCWMGRFVTATGHANRSIATQGRNDAAPGTIRSFGSPKREWLEVAFCRVPGGATIRPEGGVLTARSRIVRRQDLRVSPNSIAQARRPRKSSGNHPEEPLRRTNQRRRNASCPWFVFPGITCIYEDSSQSSYS